MDNKSYKVFSAALWRMGEKIGASSVTFLISVILARLLEPSDYGIISLIIIIINILNVFVDSGFGHALIQKKDINDEDYGTVLIVNVVFCVLLYILLFFSAPITEKFLEVEGMAIILRVCGLILLISGAKNTIQAYISRNLMFKYYFYATLSGTIISGIVAIIMAYCGLGIWSLVAQLLINPFIDTILLWNFIKWRPVISFSKKSFRSLFSFGVRVLLRDLLNTVFENMRGLFIGGFYSTSDLAYYDNGRKIPLYIYSNFDSALRSVFFPVFSSEQNDMVKLREHMLRTIRFCSFISFPLLFGLFACARQIILVIWTDKWIDSVPYLQIFCVIWAFNSIQALNQQVIMAIGRSDICLKQEILIKCISIVSIIFSVKISVYAIAVSQLIVTFIALFINLYPNRKLIKCKIGKQMLCCLPSFVSAGFMACIVYAIGLLDIEIHVLLVLQIFAGGLLYIFICCFFKFEEVKIVKKLLYYYFRRK